MSDSNETLALHRLEASRALLRRTMAESVSRAKAVAVAREASGPLQKLLIKAGNLPGLAAVLATLRLLRRGRA